MSNSFFELLKEIPLDTKATIKPVFISKDKRSKLEAESMQPQSRPIHKSTIQPEQSTDPEIIKLRAKYMGLNKEPKKVRKVNDKKFVFDWEEKDDTSSDLNPLYQKRKIPQLFGRGHMAGIDPQIQTQSKSSFYHNVITHRLTHFGEFEKNPELVALSRKKNVQLEDSHWSEKKIEEMKERDWRIFKEDYNISTKGGQIPNPLRSWNESTLSERIKDIIYQIGYKQPTPIQRQAIPIGLSNRDIIAVAETGSGKTASFLIPMVNSILSFYKLEFINALPPFTREIAHEGPYALILAPTRELAQQIEQETVKFCSRLGYKSVSIVGGHSIEEQAFSLRNGAEIVIATPGRLKDVLDQRILVLNQCTYVVMDEADSKLQSINQLKGMIDMGFEADVNYILEQLPMSNLKPDTEDSENPDSLRMRLGIDRKYRQTVMFSATMPPSVERIARKYMRRPATVIIGTAGQAVERIDQHVEYMANENDKRNRMFQVLNEFESPVIIFVNQKKTCDLVSKQLEKEGFKCATLHGGKTQDQRESALQSIKNLQKDVLVATDVARIDIKDVSLVLNYDMAKSIEGNLFFIQSFDYTHRIGRTAREGKEGVAITFITKEDEELFYDLKVILKKSRAKIPQQLLHVKPKAPGAPKRHQEIIYQA